MSYKVFFERIPDGAGSVYESDGKKSFYISNGTTVTEHDHEKEGARISVPMFEITGINPHLILYRMLTLFELLDQHRNGEDHTIICAHKDFEIVRVYNEVENIYYVTPAIISIDVNDIDLDVYHEFIPVRTGFDRTDVVNFDFNEKNIAELNRIVEVYKVIHS